MNKTPKPINIKDAVVRVADLPQEFYPVRAQSSNEKLFCIMINGEVLRSPGKRVFWHSNKKVARDVAIEIEVMDELSVSKVSLYSLWCSKVDFIDNETGQKIKPQIFKNMLIHDPVFQTVSGPEIIDQVRYMHLVDRYFFKLGIKFRIFPHIPYDLSEEELKDHVTAQSSGNSGYLEGNCVFDELVDKLIDPVKQLTKVQRTIFNTCFTVVDSVVLSLMLAQGELSSREFAIIHMLCQAITSQFGASQEEQKETFEHYTRLADRMIRFMELFEEKDSHAEILIKNGESINIEFKSSLRTPLGTQVEKHVIENEVLKTIVAFLNSDGGTLLVGVDDKGIPLGIEVDKFDSEDKYLLHFTSIFNSRIGTEMSNFVRWELDRAKDKKVLLINVKKATSPAYLSYKDKVEYYIRTGPASKALNPKETVAYIQKHFSTQNQ
jgi:chaperone required for assembly of F1-ATPase